MKLKNEKGSIAIFVLIALLFMSAILLLLFASNINKAKIVEGQFNTISQIYSYGNDAYDKAYTDIREKNKQIIAETVENKSTVELRRTYEEKLVNYRIYGKVEVNQIGLPSAYQRVEYIESTGTQYIDTEVAPTALIKCYVEYAMVDKGTLFGAITNYGVGYYGLNVRADDYQVYWGAALDGFGSWKKNEKYVMEFNNNNKIYVDGEKRYDLPTSSGFTTYSIHLFKLNGGITPSNQNCMAKIYRFKMTDGQTVIRDFIPCYRKSDNVVGMYDIVGGKFYTNKGTGTFVIPNDIGGFIPEEDGMGDLVTDIGNENYGKYKIPITIQGNSYKQDFEIYLTSSLKEGEYIDFKHKKVARADGIGEYINLPELVTFEDYTKIEVLTKIKPSKIELEYVGYTFD